MHSVCVVLTLTHCDQTDSPEHQVVVIPVSGCSCDESRVALPSEHCVQNPLKSHKPLSEYTTWSCQERLKVSSIERKG